MNISLKDYLVKFFGAKESFFSGPKDDKKSIIDFDKNRRLGFKSSNLLSKINIGKSFIPLEEVFPNNKKIKLSFESNFSRATILPFYAPDVSLKDAKKNYDKYLLDIKHRDDKKNEIDFNKYLKKYNFKETSGDSVVLSEYFFDFYDVLFHHEYEMDEFEMFGSNSNNFQNHFLINKGSHIFFLHVHSLTRVNFIKVTI